MRRIFVVAAIVWLEMLRRKDLYVLLILVGAFLLWLLALNVFGLAGMTSHVKEIGLVLLWLAAWYLTVGYAARQLPREETSGTIFALLSKPLARGHLIVGKWLGAWGGGVLASAFFYVLLALIMLARGSGFQAGIFWQHWLLQTAFLAILAALAVLFSTHLHADAAAALAWIASGCAYFLLPRVPELALHETGWRQTLLLLLYFWLPHLEIFDLRLRLAHGWDPVGWRLIMLILLYGAAVVAGLLLLSWLFYRNKRFSRAIRL